MGFGELLAGDNIILFDGGMGTELARQGYDMGPDGNLKNPDAVLSVHRAYCQAGVDVIITNTFSLNRLAGRGSNSEFDFEAANVAGVRLAREAAAGEALVFGDIGPTGQLLEPYGTCSEKQLGEAFSEQVSALAAAGVDGLIVETMTDLREAICALKACQKIIDLPLILSLAFKTDQKGGRTVMGSTVAEAAAVAEEYALAAVGANCGDLGPEGLASIAGLFKAVTSIPVIIQPNAGMPKLVNGETRFDMEPEDYAEGVYRAVEAGASMVGGCCGTTPGHIAALNRRLTAMGKRDSAR